MRLFFSALAVIFTVKQPHVFALGELSTVGEVGDSYGSIMLSDGCGTSIGKIHTLVEPSFPSSGRGWTQKLIFHALKAAGATLVNSTHSTRHAGHLLELNGEKLDWIFSHEGDAETEKVMQASLNHPERPQVILRVVRNGLDNVEAYYRYVYKETGEKLNWNIFAKQKLLQYKSFHRYWDGQCRLQGDKARCCVTVTYEDMQNDMFLRRTLRQLMRVWLTPVLTSQQISDAVLEAVQTSPPKHITTESQYASGNRYKAVHHMMLALA